MAFSLQGLIKGATSIEIAEPIPFHEDQGKGRVAFGGMSSWRGCKLPFPLFSSTLSGIGHRSSHLFSTPVELAVLE
jgi:hypothetical protein